MSIPFFIVVIVTIIFSSSQGDCQVTPDLSTQFVTSSDSASQTDWTKKGSIANVTAGKVFHAWVSKGLSGASAAGIVGWVNSEGGFGKYSWNYRYVTTAELKNEGYTFYNPAKLGHQIMKSVGTVGK